jgi:hypothetical protein
MALETSSWGPEELTKDFSHVQKKKTHAIRLNHDALKPN